MSKSGKRQAQIERLKRAGFEPSDFRELVKNLKREGVIPSRTDLRKVKPTRYRISQVKKNFDIATGTAAFIRPKNRAEKEALKKYEEAGVYPWRGAGLVIPKDQVNQKTKLRRGLVVADTQVGKSDVWIERITLPFNAVNMLELADKIERDETIDFKEGYDQFTFSVFGHQARDNGVAAGFVDKKAMADYIKNRYQHLFKGQTGKQAIVHFRLFKFRNKGNMTPQEIGPDAGEKFYSQKGTGRNPRVQDNGRTDWYARKVYNASLDRRHETLKKKVAKMSNQEREAYLQAGRERARLSRARRKAKDTW